MFTNATQETRTFFLKTSSNNYDRKSSNSNFVISTIHTPVELNDGVVGVSLVSAAFPQNQANITTKNNVFRWQIPRVVTFTPTGSHSFQWSVRGSSTNHLWSAWQTHTASGGELAAFDHITTWAAQINPTIQAAYNALTGDTATNVAFGAYAGTGWHIQGEQQKSIATFTVSGQYEWEFGAVSNGNYLSLVGFSDTGRLAIGTSNPYNQTFIGSFAPNSWAETITPGQYTFTELAAAIKTAMELRAGVAVTSFDEVSTIDQRAKMNLSIDGGPYLDSEPFIWGDHFGTTMGNTLGLPADVQSFTPTGYVDPDYTYEATFSHVANLHGPSVVYLYSQLLAGRTTLDGDSGGIVPIVKQIPITAAYREIESYRNDDNGVPDISFPRSRRKHFSEVDMKLVDQYGDPIDIGSGDLEVMWKLYY
jgi:hypothetical protein